ncbi:tyrosine-type recombinase/integrase [Yersinia enterocolitica]|uniref:tyrosine-type recombinase/integrase n=1 Tax=Yersinia enterocolitica TaxID=630 RepID=UPI00313E92A4
MIVALTALEVKSFSCPEGKLQVKKSDGNGLFLLVKSNGSKLWRFRYKYSGKHQEMAFGQYPMISLSMARELTGNARLLLVQGLNPMDERRERKRNSNAIDLTFESIALKWWDQQKESWTEDNCKKIKRWITLDAKQICPIRIDLIDQGHITEVMQSIASAGTPKKAPPILSVINRIFGFALAHRLTRSNPAQNLPLKDIIGPMQKVKHRAAITLTSDLAHLIKDIDSNESGTFCTIEALKLIPRVFLRPKEIRFLKWDYIDFEAKIIRIPEEEMKRDREHLVPMSNQVYKQLKHIQMTTGYSKFVFPSERNSDLPISKNVLVNRLRVLGYGADIMSAHGFRSTASTILHETGWQPEVIEAQLAHLTGTATSRAYNRSIFLSERKKMMQVWADFLDGLAVGKREIS